MTERLTEKITNKETGEVLLYRLKGQWGGIGDNRMRVTKKLGELEDAEEEGRLVVLPCKVGDAVYVIEDKYYEYVYHKGIQKGHVCRFEYDKEWFAWIHIDGCNKDLQIAYKTSNFNQTVFLTRGEAEKALKEMEKDDAAN